MIHDLENEEDARLMLEAIYRETEGDPTRTAGMWAVGAGLGLDRSRTEDVTMAMAGEGLLEIKSLSGGVALTEAGLAKVGSAGPAAPKPGGEPDLAGFLEQVAAALPDLGLDASAGKDLEADLQTLRAQGERTEPIPAVVQAVLQEIRRSLEAAPGREGRRLLEVLSEMFPD